MLSPPICNNRRTCDARGKTSEDGPRLVAQAWRRYLAAGADEHRHHFARGRMSTMISAELPICGPTGVIAIACPGV